MGDYDQTNEFRIKVIFVKYKKILFKKKEIYLFIIEVQSKYNIYRLKLIII